MVEIINKPYYWKPKEPMLIYDHPLPKPPDGCTPASLLDFITSSSCDRPDAYNVVSAMVYEIASNKLEYMGDVIIGLRVGDNDETINGDFETDCDEPYYYCSYTDWWEGEEKIWLKYVILVDGIDDLMKGVDSNG